MTNFMISRYTIGTHAWILVFLMMASAGAHAQRPPDPPAPPWSEFVTTEGHAIPIPKQWLATEEGRFAHSIKLPASVPTTVPFDFSAARWKALKPSRPSVARQYWEHLCATEAGSFIVKPVEKVDGFFFMRPVGGANEQQNNDRWNLEAPGLQASWGFEYNPRREATRFVDPPWETFEWVDFPEPTKRGVLHMSGHIDRVSPMKVEPQPESKAEYALIWRGIRRERDRNYAISGAEWIALNRHTGEVLGVLRDFYLTGMTTNQTGGIYWLNAARCPFKKKLFGQGGVDGEARLWAPMVIRPRVYPKALVGTDERTNETIK
jgi:hypothetical protein